MIDDEKMFQVCLLEALNEHNQLLEKQNILLQQLIEAIKWLK